MDTILVNDVSGTAVGGLVTVNGSNSNAYTTRITNDLGDSDKSFVVFNLADLSPAALSLIKTGNQSVTLSLTTYTDSISAENLTVYAGGETAAEQAEVSNQGTSNAKAAWSSLAPNSFTQVGSVDVRKGVSGFSSSENENGVVSFNITNAVAAALAAGETSLTIWFTTSYTPAATAVDLSNLSVTVSGLVTTPSVVSNQGGLIVTGPSAFKPFGAVTLGPSAATAYAPGNGAIVVPIETEDGVSTSFVDQSTALVSTNQYFILQSSAAAGTLSGPGLATTPLFVGAGQVGYMISATGANISAALQALTFTPGASGAATTFTIEELNGLNGSPGGVPIPLSGGIVTVIGTSDSYDVIPNGTTELVLSGGVTTGNSLHAAFKPDANGNTNQYVTVIYGDEVVEAGGTARSTYVSGGTLTVQNGGASVGTSLQGIGLIRPQQSDLELDSFEDVQSGGQSTSASISVGAIQTIEAGAQGFTPTIAGGDEEDHGTVDGATITGGVQNVYGVATNTTIKGGKQEVFSGGQSSATTVRGGVLQVDAGGTISNLVLSGGSAVLRNGSTITGVLTFTAPSSLEIDAPVGSPSSLFPVVLNKLSGGMVIDLVGLTYTSTTTATDTGSLLTVSNGQVTEYFLLENSSSQALFASDDGHGGTEIQTPLGNSTGSNVATNLPPTVTGERVQPANAANPFPLAQITDPNPGSTEAVTITMSDGGASGTLTGAGLSGGNGIYTLSGTASSVTSALHGIKFNRGDLQPNSTTTIGFTISDTTSVGTTASDPNFALTVTAQATNPTLVGGTTLVVTSEGSSTPFASAILTDPNANSTDVLTIKLSRPGTLSGVGLVQTSAGIYTLSGTGASVTAALQTLLFTPTAGQANTSATTTFSLSDLTTAGTQTSSLGKFGVTDVDPAAAPTLGGGTALTVQSEATSTPFAMATLADPNANSTETLTIQLAGAGGVLSGAGLSGGTGGAYTLSGSVASVVAALPALVFTPAAGTPGGSTTTTFTLTDTTTAGTTASLNAFSVTDTDPAVAPTLTGAAALTVQNEAASTPFAGASLTDPNANSTDTLAIQLSNGGAGGTLSGAGLSGGTSGAYALSGTAAQVTAALQALVFTPVQGASNASVTTTFTLTDTTTPGTTATDAAFSVTDSDPVGTAGTLSATGSTFNPGTVSNMTIDATSAGSHTVIAGSGNKNFLHFGTGNGTVSGTGAGDAILAGNGTISVSGLGSGTSVALGDGNDTVNLAAAGARNVITTGNGNSHIAAGNGGYEQVTVGNGANVISAGGAGDVVLTGNGSNTVTATGAGAAITTGSGADTITVTGAGGAMIRAGLGLNKISFAGTGNVIVNQGGNDTLTDNGSGNTIVLPLAASGLVTIGSNALANGDVFDLRAAMAATAWDHQASDIGTYLSVGSQGGNATVNIDPSGAPSGPASTIAVITGGGSLTLAAFLPHTLT